jgi:hypothetical protein
MRGLAILAMLAAPPFHARVERIPSSVRADMKSWHRGCPVGLGDLRLLTLSYWGFDRRAHAGRLIVHRDAVRPVRRALHSLYDARFPIRRMRLVDDYGASDDRSMAADNTSAFNCRLAAGSSHWSMHAYGRAIDVNPRENPMILHGRPEPPNARRSGRGVIHAGGVAVRAFARAGWSWGGRWSAPDYQHFSSTGG